MPRLCLATLVYEVLIWQIPFAISCQLAYHTELRWLTNLLQLYFPASTGSLNNAQSRAFVKHASSATLDEDITNFKLLLFNGVYRHSRLHIIIMAAMYVQS